MITRRTKIQLAIFVVITLVGVSFVGARYARLDRLFFDDAYAVTVHLSDSGGIFAGGAVSYRGVSIGRVDELILTDDGVDAVLAIDNEWDDIPADSLALVGNGSAVGEQYIELQPQTDEGPFLDEGSEIDVADTALPISTEKLLTDLSRTVQSVDQDALRTTVSELGQAFGGAGQDLQRIIDTSSSFIETANDNFDVTTALIRDANTVLNGQIDSESALRTFASELSLFSDTLAGSDRDLRRLIDTGSVASSELRRLIEDNRVELGDLLNNLVTTGEIVNANLDGIEQILVIYPYVVEGGFTVVSKSPDTGLFDAHFGLVLSTTTPCTNGYEGTDKRTPQNTENRATNENARCTDPPSQTNPRGAQNLPRAAPGYDAPVVGSFDPDTGAFTWGTEQAEALEATGTVAPQTLGKDSWKWLFLQPLTAARE